MAEYKLTYTSDGVIKKELSYRGEVFDCSMIPDEYGKTSDKKAFDHQVEDKFPDEKEVIIDMLAELGFADDAEIEEILAALTVRENVLKRQKS